MTKQEVLAKLNSVISKEESQWFKQAQYREDNYDDIKKAQKIALIVLRTIRARKMSQVALAEKMGTTPQLVNKWLKGKENFTLSTVEKLEKALDIKLLQILEPKPQLKIIKSSSVTIQAYGYSRIIRRESTYTMTLHKSKKEPVQFGLTRPIIPKLELCQA
jgi:transcriptional regulator with XRE-family HTH domain